MFEFIEFKFRKQWLTLEGSPKSKISKCESSEMESISALEFKDFDIIR